MMPSNSNKYQSGDIVLVKFPFSDLRRSKQRPALVLAVVNFSVSVDLLIVAMITSKIESPRVAGDVLLEDWKVAHLLHPSLVRLSKLTTLEEDLVVGRMGHLPPKALKEMRQQLKELFSL